MNVCVTGSMVMHSCAKYDIYGMTVKVQKSCDLNTAMLKPYKFDLEVKGQHHIRIINVGTSLSYGDRPMCQI